MADFSRFGAHLPRGHFSRFGVKVPHFSNKDPRVGDARWRDMDFLDSAIAHTSSSAKGMAKGVDISRTETPCPTHAAVARDEASEQTSAEVMRAIEATRVQRSSSCRRRSEMAQDLGWPH